MELRHPEVGQSEELTPTTQGHIVCPTVCRTVFRTHTVGHKESIFFIGENLNLISVLTSALLHSLSNYSSPFPQ